MCDVISIVALHLSPFEQYYTITATDWLSQAGVYVETMCYIEVVLEAILVS